MKFLKRFKRIGTSTIVLTMLVSSMSFSMVSADTTTNMINNTNPNQKIVTTDMEMQPSGVATSKIAIAIGGVIVGYLYATVIDGVVISATGQSGAEWVSEAIDAVVGELYKQEVEIPDYWDIDPSTPWSVNT